MSGHDRYIEMLARRRELAATERTNLDEHLAGCPACAFLAQEYAAQSVALRTMPQAVPPPILRARVLAATRATPSHRASILTYLPRLTAVASMALLAVILVFAWAHRPTSGSSSALTASSTPVHVVAHPTSTAPAGRARATSASTAASVKRAKSHATSTHRHGTAGNRGSAPAQSTALPGWTPPPNAGVAALPPPTTAPYAPVNGSIAATIVPTPGVSLMPTEATTLSQRPTVRHLRPTATAGAGPVHVAAGAHPPTSPVKPPIVVPQPPSVGVPSPTAGPFTMPAPVDTPATTPVAAQAIGASPTTTPSSTALAVPPPFIPPPPVPTPQPAEPQPTPTATPS